MELRYTGPFAAVVVPIADGTGVEIARGETGEVPDDVAVGLLAQADDWAHARPRSNEAKAAAAQVAEAQAVPADNPAPAAPDAPAPNDAPAA